MRLIASTVGSVVGVAHRRPALWVGSVADQKQRRGLPVTDVSARSRTELEEVNRGREMETVEQALKEAASRPKDKGWRVTKEKR